MGMTLTEKIMARASGRNELRAGEIVYPKADLATIHDLYVLYVVDADRQLTELGVERPRDSSHAGGFYPEGGVEFKYLMLFSQPHHPTQL